MANSRLKPGDIVEIPTAKGFYYAVYTHRVKNWGYLIQIYNFPCKVRPMDFSFLKDEQVILKTMTPLQTIVNRDIFPLVGRIPITEDMKIPPTFKDSISDGRKDDWWLWDGGEEWFVGFLTESQKKEYPDRMVCTDLYIQDRLEKMGEASA